MNKIRSKSGVRKGMKRYARRKYRSTLSGRYVLSNDVTRAQVEYYDTLAIANGANTLLFTNPSTTYLGIVTALQNSTSFQDLYPIYARYKICGMSVRCSTAQDTSFITTKIAQGSPSCSAAFYPNLNGTGIGQNPSFNDHKLILEPGLTTVQSKYWKFPDNYFEGNGFGFGVWSQTNGYTNQTGQISVCVNPSISNATADVFLFNIRITLYIMLSDKNR